MKRKNLGYRWIIFGVLAIAYFFVYFHRVSTAIVAPELIKEFAISGSLLGILASAYFYPYTMMQIPVGLLSDSLGPRKTVTIFLIIASVGAVLFGLATRIEMAIFARILVGLGVSAIFVPTLKILAEWFKTREFATTTGILMGIGGAGWLSASAPLAFLTNWLGWRFAFIVIGTITLILSILIWILVIDNPQKIGLPKITEHSSSKDQIKTFQGVKTVLCEKYFWPLAGWFFFTYGSVMGFGGLWGGPYFIEIYKLSKVHTGDILMMISIGLLVGSPFFGWLSDKILGSRKPILIVGTACFCLVWLCFYIWPDSLPSIALYILSFSIGFFGCATCIVTFAANKELFPTSIAGTSTGIVNLFPFAGGAVFPPIMGYIMDKFGKINGVYPVEAYKNIFLVCFIASCLALLGICFMKETLKSPVRK